MGLGLAVLRGIAEQSKMRRMLLRQNKRQANISELHQGPRFILILHIAAERAAVNPGSRAGKDPNNPTDSRFVLLKAERKNTEGRNIVPPDTGTSKAAGSSTGPTYRLSAIDSQLSPFTGTKVEISGEVLPSAPEGGAATGTAPTLQVEFVQKLSETCS